MGISEMYKTKPGVMRRRLKVWDLVSGNGTEPGDIASGQYVLKVAWTYRRKPGLTGGSWD